MSDLRLRERWEDPLLVPPAAHRVLEAAVELVASSDDAFEYRPDPERDSQRSLAGRLAWRLQVRQMQDDPDGEAPTEEAVAQHLSTLARAELLVPTADGGLRLGVDCRPKPRRPAPKPISERKQRAQEGNSARSARLRAAAKQLQSGGHDGPTLGPTDAPTVGPNEAPNEAAVGSHGGSSVGPGPRAPGLSSSCLAAAAASPEEPIKSYTCTAAAAVGSTEPAAPKPRADAGGCEAAADTQDGPTVGPEAAPSVAPTGAPTEEPAVDAAVRIQLLALRLVQVARVDGRRGDPPSVCAARWLGYGLTPERIIAKMGIVVEQHDARVARGKAEPIGTLDYFDDLLRVEAGLPVKPNAKQTLLANAPPAAAAPQSAARSPAEVARAAEKRARRNALGATGRADLEEAIDALDKGDQAALQRCIQRLHQTRPYVLTALIEERPEVGALYERMRQATAAPTRIPESRTSTIG